MTSESDGSAGNPASIKLPAWVGGYGVIGLVVLQGLGIDPSTFTGQGQAKQIATLTSQVSGIDTRMGRAWTEINGQRVKLNELKSDNRILFERSTRGEADRADIKSALRELTSAMAILAQSSVRVETKLDAVLKDRPR